MTGNYSNCLLSALVPLVLALFVTGQTADTFGPFKVVMKKATICKGPKKSDCNKILFDIQPDQQSAFTSSDVIEAVVPEKAKILLIKNENNQKTEALRMQMNKPCEHFFLRPLFNSMLNATKSCVIPKGQYNHTINMNEVAQNYFGGRFFYGNYTVKSTIFNNKCNFLCLYLDMSIEAKNEV